MLNVGYDKEGNINVIGHKLIPVLRELNEIAITTKVLRMDMKMKVRTTRVLDDFPVECLKKGGMLVFN